MWDTLPLGAVFKQKCSKHSMCSRLTCIGVVWGANDANVFIFCIEHLGFKACPLTSVRCL